MTRTAIQQLQRVERDLTAANDRPSLSAALDGLAALAGRHEPALQRLLVELAERDLVRVSVRAYFFDDELVDDAIQETVLAVASGIAGFRGDASFLTWLDRVARNAAKRVRERHVRRPQPVDDLGEVAVIARRVSSVVVDERTVRAALAEMSPDYRAVLVLREVDDLSYEQIAARLGVPLNTVRSRLRRARAQLAGLLVALQARE